MAGAAYAFVDFAQRQFKQLAILDLQENDIPP
jgi:hypothetical protein